MDDVVSWSVQQTAALKAIKDWFQDRRAGQVFRLFGFAGTGKTTIARELHSIVPYGLRYAAFTGKAALVLREKGCLNAQTIHSLIYSPDVDERGRLKFRLNDDSPLNYARLLVVDECSMVDNKLADDLLSFGVKLLVLGDPAQLPPVKGAGALTDAQPDFLLTDIHRQAADNPIIRMSMDIREGRGLRRGQYGESRVASLQELHADDVVGADQRIVGMNATRRQWNIRMRSLLGRTQVACPEPGDRLICLRNNGEHGLLNGQQWDCAEVHGADDVSVKLTIKETDREMLVDALTAPFRGDDIKMHWAERALYDEFDFGYTITAHKAQGSQWDNVVIRNEAHVFREHAQRWLYTAVTRAAKRVVVVQ